MKVAMMVIATGKYIKFVAPLWESAKRFFLSNHELSMFVFTDSPEVPHGTIRIEHQHAPWPGPTLMRYHVFDKHKDILSKQDYLYYSDADMLFVDKVGDEVLGDLVGTIHPGFYNKPKEQFSYERRPESTAYIPLGCGHYYFAGGFNGGTAPRFLSMASEIKSQIDTDLSKNIVAIWHDESHMNKYFTGNQPTVRLSPSYCYPESWSMPFQKRLLALDKNHAEVRN